MISKKGAIALPSILMLSAILLIVGIAMSVSALMQNSIVYDQNEAAASSYAAESGIKDAIEKVTRNKNYDNGAGYCLVVGDGKASIVVTKDVVNGVPSSGHTQIISTGTSSTNNCIAAGKYFKKINVILNVNGNGNVTIDSWEELTI